MEVCANPEVGTQLTTMEQIHVELCGLKKSRVLSSELRVFHLTCILFCARCRNTGYYLPVILVRNKNTQNIVWEEDK